MAVNYLTGENALRSFLRKADEFHGFEALKYDIFQFVLTLALSVLNPGHHDTHHGRRDDGNEIVKPRGVNNTGEAALQAVGTAAQTCIKHVAAVYVDDSLYNIGMIIPCAEHSFA